MKKVLSSVLILLSVLSMTLPVCAAEKDQAQGASAYTIVVSEQAIDTSDLPCAPYYEGETLMVPLRKIGEALGYQVAWDAKTGVITMEDTYIQKATLYNGTDAVVFEGKLQIINMSREIKNDAKTVVHSGYTYVPLAFFEEFLNDVAVEGATITIAPSKAELQTQNGN